MLNLCKSRPTLPGMVKKPKPQLLSTFDVFRVAHKDIWLGTVQASDERDAIERVASEKYPGLASTSCLGSLRGGQHVQANKTKHRFRTWPLG
jgi:hypothetical protein